MIWLALILAPVAIWALYFWLNRRAVRSLERDMARLDAAQREYDKALRAFRARLKFISRGAGGGR